MGNPNVKPRQDGKGSKSESRREELLRKAADLIAQKGFEGTSMRDIAAAVNILPGSLYHHFKSKEDMLIEIHQRVVDRMYDRVVEAIEAGKTPWEKLENAAVAHFEGLIESRNLVNIISPNFPEERGAINEQIKEQRSRYEDVFRDLFAGLDLRPDVQPNVLRLQVLGSLNFAPFWFREGGGLTATDVARQFVRNLRQGCAPLA
ncbi:putative transcriptional regulator TetR family protein [Seohaeicola zhoushanensis]|uniref:Putative transcriptional regulator TetR family protein n=1 Tax=Seohaeicola zhoushanensis TaxID=1569283 RepID=A0A8J3M8Z9_9RHOB|nr:putative transcriptional regulator TetR family protein [Seohaeicola zhoushanensis]